MRGLFLLLLIAACDYQPRPGSAKTKPTAPATTAVTAGAACHLTLAVDGMT